MGITLPVRGEGGQGREASKQGRQPQHPLEDPCEEAEPHCHWTERQPEQTERGLRGGATGLGEEVGEGET